MSKLRPVHASFQLESNKIIDFPLLKPPSGMLRSAAESETYGYAADIAFLSLYTKEILSINIPVINHSKLDQYPAWANSVSLLKADVLTWDNTVLPAIIAFPDAMQAGYVDIQDEFNDVKSYVKYIIDAIEHEEDYTSYINRFNDHFDKLQQNTEKGLKKLNNFYDMLNKHQERLDKEKDKLESLSKDVCKLNEEQEKQIKQIESDIKKYEESRKAYIAGACLTGIAAGAAIGGGIAAIILVPGIGICIGVAAFFGATILGTGTAICAEEAVKLLKKIEALGDDKNQIDIEKKSIALIGTQFNLHASHIDALVESVKDIIQNWEGVSSVLNNISKAVADVKKRLSGKEKESTNTEEEIWRAIQNDLSSLEKIVASLNEGIQTMSVKTKIYTDCDLSKCKTEEEILKKLEEFVKEESQKDLAS